MWTFTTSSKKGFGFCNHLVMASISFLVLPITTTTEAFKRFASDCSAGTDALLQPNQVVDLQTHALYAQVGGGELSDYGLKMELNGIALDVATPTDFDVGKDYTLSLTAAGDGDDAAAVAGGGGDRRYAGFFVRMEVAEGDDAYSGESTFGALQPMDDSVQVVSPCAPGGRRAGVSHTENSRKQQTNMTLSMGAPATGLILDVTVVVEMSEARNVSHWYYSQFILNALIPEGGIPTDAPTDQPTAAEATTATPSPTTVTTENPTATPSELAVDSGDDSSSGYSLSVIGIAAAMQMSLLLWSLLDL